MARRIEINPGDVYGFLTVIEENPIKYYPGAKGKAGAYRNFKCRCVCGKVIESQSLGHLRGRRGLSCGCQKGTHKKSASPEYSVYRQIKQRCYNPNSKHFRLYGGMGVRVCSRWLNGEGKKSGFECFIKDMGPRPKRASIDRYPDKNGDYCPSNTRWASSKQQQRNLRSNNLISYRGHTKCAAEWAEIAQKDPSALRRKSNANHLDKILSRWLPDYPEAT